MRIATSLPSEQMSEGPYTPAFFATALDASYPSARRIVPLILGLVPARSVLDVGCGVGHFLRAFAEAGIADIVGIDGDYVPHEQLAIDPWHFSSCDLAKGFDLQRRFDLVVSIEVAEHLPPSAAEMFIASLARHGDVVMFSAALPYQGGTGHVNEQWPSYWAGLFRRNGYRAYDAIRPVIWGDRQVAWWYCQNTIVFANDAAHGKYPALAALPSTEGIALDHVHPVTYSRIVQALQAAHEQLALPRQSRPRR